jgi:hypothetical protein
MAEDNYGSLHHEVAEILVKILVRMVKRISGEDEGNRSVTV